MRTVDEYDPVKDRWTSVASMEARRSTLGVAVLNDHIYAVEEKSAWNINFKVMSNLNQLIGRWI